ncbi:hypothetical protein LP125_010 [Listeria phage LP-125]|uniref:Uncharacterized protein n=4 Tax=Pecentumvirus TaxID=1857844 RepID=S4U646_9CAUD|nr:hypothetical protein QLX35_gp011 [Listeria phage LP-125]YP_009592540.1 hypothetical protein FDG78_gp011 [Listeria phage LP-064]AII27411.1 hypothetical protein [Listeria phage LMTA-34]QNL32145.1 hypothetical protein HUK30_0183 [Listeria phage LP-Mix_6.2]AGI11335.1 hypothetical protein LP125_010 [Listeria phage LP-125]AHL19031.1 hypothetical protein LP064_011 [Listeria phage LP-064]
MAINKNKNSVAVVKTQTGKIIGYLSTKDIDSSVDIQMDMQGYTVEAL